MSASQKPTKLIIVIAGAAIMVGIALAIVLNYQANITAQDESLEGTPDIEVLVPEGIVMRSGETKVIPVELRIMSKEPITANIVAYSVTSEAALEETTMSGSDDLAGQFEKLRQKGFSDGFEGSFDIESFSSAGNSEGDASIETTNLTMEAPTNIAAGDYAFATSVLGDTMTWDFISTSAFVITIE